jgi:hypothetical protein
MATEVPEAAFFLKVTLPITTPTMATKVIVANTIPMPRTMPLQGSNRHPVQSLS